ncbi:MAG: NFACT family protein [Candidatus Woesearchaeota archaeon]
MKRAYSGVDLHFLLKELELENSKIEKIYQFGKKEFIFRLYTKKGKRHLRIDLEGNVHVTYKNYQGPKKPPEYVLFLRKHLNNARIRKVYQKGLERILVLEIETKTKKYELIFELFGGGNVVLVSEEMIIHPLETQVFKDRKIKSKEKYLFPPSQLDIKTMSAEKAEKILLESNDKIGKFLATDFGLGGIYSDEIITRAKINKDSEVKDCKKIVVLIKNLLAEEISAHVSQENAYPIELETVKTQKKYDSFSLALDEFFELKKPKKEQAQKSKAKNKYETIILAQEKRAKKLKEEAEEAQKKGEFIYEKYQDFKLLLDKIKELQKNHSLTEIEEILKQNKFVKSIDKKNKKINLEFK